MLTEIFVKNYAIIDEIRLQFGSGFSILSGETGAGKSILVGALSLILGGKAIPAMVRSGEKEAIIEAVFDIKNHTPLKKFLEEAGLHDEDQLMIRRHVFVEGRNKIYINGRSISLSQLETIAPWLVDLSGQHDQQELLHEENHRLIIDQHETIQDLLKNYNQVYQSYLKIKGEYDQLHKIQNERESKLDFLGFQLKEIQAANIQDVCEEKNLLTEKTRVKNADKLFELARGGNNRVSEGEGSILVQLNQLSSQIQKGLSNDSSLEEGLKLIKQAQIPLDELGEYFARYLESLTIEPGRLDEIESRLFLLHQLKKKHGDSLSAIKEKQQELERELKQLENFDDTLAQKEKELSEIKKILIDRGKKLSKFRKKLARELEEKIQKELKALSMPRVVFHIAVNSPINPQVDECDAHGFDSIRFDLAPNVGEAPKPLSKIASGGELSRVLLAIKQVLGARPHPLTFIFDEVDSGIGGAVAEVVGKKLLSISEKNQVLHHTQ